jgi:hypothetical protein
MNAASSCGMGRCSGWVEAASCVVTGGIAAWGVPESVLGAAVASADGADLTCGPLLAWSVVDSGAEPLCETAKMIKITIPIPKMIPTMRFRSFRSELAGPPSPSERRSTPAGGVSANEAPQREQNRASSGTHELHFGQ